MAKILLAVGFRQLEEYLIKQLKSEYLFVGEALYKEGVVRAIGQTEPDIVIIRETLSGNENIMNIIYDIRSKFPKVRIIFVAGKREAGDSLLTTLVNYGVYDILQGEKVQANQIVALVRKPNEYKDVKHYQPVPSMMGKETKKEFDVQLTHTQTAETVVDSEIPKLETEEFPLTSEVQQEKKSIFAKLPQIPIDKFSKTQNEEVPSVKDVVQKEKKTKPAPVSLPPQTNSQMRITGSKNIITFIGGKSGVGTTSIAVNVATMLAATGSKVIFVEMNDQMPSVPYWFEMGHMTRGIDSCLKGIENNAFDEIEKAIIKTKDLKGKDGGLQKSYNKFPKTLDFLVFSQAFLAGDKEKVPMHLVKELYIQLMFQYKYDYVILDVPYDIKNVMTHDALIYSNKVFTVVTQDVSSLGYHLFSLNELEKSGIQVKEKTHYVINKFEPAEIGVNEIIDWIESKNVLTIPSKGKDFINANFVGLPTCIYSKNSEIKDSLMKLISLL